MALSVAVAGRNEVADFGLREWTRPDEVRTRLQAELPAGIEIRSAQATGIHPGRRPVELAYRVPLLEGHSLCEAAVRELLATDAVTVKRARKDEVREVEVRQFIKALRLEGEAVHMLLRCTEGGTARPDEVMEVLGCREGVDYRKGAIERTHVNLSS